MRRTGPGLALALAVAATALSAQTPPESGEALTVHPEARDAIVELVIAEYGEEWRAEPQASGAGLWAWLLPPLALLGGVVLVGALLARRRSDHAPTLVVEASPEEEKRLREALEELDEEEEPAV